MQNIKEFENIAKSLFKQLADSFPVPVQVDICINLGIEPAGLFDPNSLNWDAELNHIKQHTKIELRQFAKPIECYWFTVDWLIAEGFIMPQYANATLIKSNSFKFNPLTLTAKTLKLIAMKDKSFVDLEILPNRLIIDAINEL